MRAGNVKNTILRRLRLPFAVTLSLAIVSCQDSDFGFTGRSEVDTTAAPEPTQPECGTGSYRPSTGDQQSCQPWSVCKENEHEVQAPSPTTDRICAPNATTCSEGSFKTSTGDQPLACQPWTVCGPSESEVQEPSAERDRTCAPNQQATACSDGQEPSAERDRTCAPNQQATACSDGQYRTSQPGAPLVCAPWTECGPTEYENRAPTPESDRGCLANPCRRGTIPHTPPTATTPRVCRVLYRDCAGPDGQMNPNRDEFVVPGKGCRIYLLAWAPGEPNNHPWPSADPNGNLDGEDFVHARASGWNDAHFSGFIRNDPAGGGKYICATGEIPDFSNLSRTLTIHQASDRRRVCPAGSVFAKPETLEEQQVLLNQFATEIADIVTPVWINFHRESDDTFQSTQ